MEKMTIHRGLAELKLIDARIEKAISQIIPSGTMQKQKKVNGLFDKEDFESAASGKLQSVNDLIQRKRKIKSAIVFANATTKVDIGGNEMTIADAINYKPVIESKKLLVTRLKQQHKVAVLEVAQKNQLVSQNALKLAEAALSKDNVKINDGDAVAITKPYIEDNTFHLVDPLKVDGLIEKIESEIAEFEAEIDATLSEINAITFIEF